MYGAHYALGHSRPGPQSGLQRCGGCDWRADSNGAERRAEQRVATPRGYHGDAARRFLPFPTGRTLSDAAPCRAAPRPARPVGPERRGAVRFGMARPARGGSPPIQSFCAAWSNSDLNSTLPLPANVFPHSNFVRQFWFCHVLSEVPQFILNRIPYSKSDQIRHQSTFTPSPLSPTSLRSYFHPASTPLSPHPWVSRHVCIFCSAS